MSTGCTPNWSDWLNTTWGWPDDNIPALGYGANNVVVGANPAYTLQDFLAIYPKFGGQPLIQSATVTQGNPQITVASTSGMAAGNPVAGAGIPDGALILTVDSGTQFTMNTPANAGGTVPVTVWNAPPIPFVVISLYIALASASLVQARWLEQWPLAMALYVAHFLTLYARSDGNPNSTIGQIAAQGLSLGIQTAKSVGDVSVSYQPVTGLEDWGMWTLTIYGTQLAQLAKIIGSGPMLLY